MGGSSLSAAPTSLDRRLATYKHCDPTVPLQARRMHPSAVIGKQRRVRRRESRSVSERLWQWPRSYSCWDCRTATDASPIFSLISLEGLVNLGIAERDPRDGNISVVQTQGGTELREPTKTTKTALAAAAAGMPAPTSPMVNRHCGA